jgi:hypothetical protein
MDAGALTLLLLAGAVAAGGLLWRRPSTVSPDEPTATGETADDGEGVPAEATSGEFADDDATADGAGRPDNEETA